MDIKEFAKKNNVQFDMYSKVDVNGKLSLLVTSFVFISTLFSIGDTAIELFKWLKKEQGGIFGFNSIKWNFTKFLIDQNGMVIKRFGNPLSDVEPDVKALLPE